MRTLATLSACALLALAAPAFAQSNGGDSMKKDLRQNGSPTGVAPSHAKQHGAANTESGPVKVPKEVRSSATDRQGTSGTNSDPNAGSNKSGSGNSGSTSGSGK